MSKIFQRNQKKKLTSYALVVNRIGFVRKNFFLSLNSISVSQKVDPQPSLHLVRFGEKPNDIPKKKATFLLRDVKTIDFTPLNNDKRPQSSNMFDLRTTDREYSLMVSTIEEKKEFLNNLKKVSSRRRKNKRLFDDFVSFR